MHIITAHWAKCLYPNEINCKVAYAFTLHNIYSKQCVYFNRSLVNVFSQYLLRKEMGRLKSDKSELNVSWPNDRPEIHKVFVVFWVMLFPSWNTIVKVPANVCQSLPSVLEKAKFQTFGLQQIYASACIYCRRYKKSEVYLKTYSLWHRRKVPNVFYPRKIPTRRVLRLWQILGHLYVITLR